MKKMFIGIIFIASIYVTAGAAAYFRGPLLLGARLKSIYPYRLSPIVWIKSYGPSANTSDAAMKLGYSEQGKYNIVTGHWEKLTE